MKLELNVVRMTNEDVIATSAQVCSEHPQAAHIYTISYIDGSNSINAKFYYAGQTVPNSSGNYSATNDFESTPAKAKWYYYDPSSGTYGRYVECTGDHSGYTTDSN